MKRDTNARVAALLRELAAVQPSTQKKWAYRRAADAVLALDEPLESLLQPDGTLRKIPHVGPSSLRVIDEYLRTGRSETVERALAGHTGRLDDRARDAGDTFLSSAQVAAVLAFEPQRGLGPRHYRGDLQMHSTYSDGRATIAQLVEGCLARGYQYCAVTDHSHGLPIARGVSMRALAEQHAEVDALNRQYAGRFRIIKGIEANILADGTLDMSPSERRALELVLAAPHSRLRSRDDQTDRLVRAVRTPGVHILAHPRGRKLGSRPGIVADWHLVFEAAAEAGVAIEIDGDPSRQDVDYVLAKQALAAGCLFALDSDGHSVDELRYADTAIAHARLAGLPPDRVLNCWGVDTLLDWAARRR